ncbi:hypothetical protein BXY85_3045 [Roseivirga pacifica]|uniref:Lysophospholipase L1 n=1 Tax=Roseivirga pacifica TaxID=1267423 RepID=A0A1I0QX70_9BACT|nr:hypothetical protein [Roseivirga pacifica]RKQ42435.1 hypothetical protein BXY85_3045 [Roseivirga pacifica]SEW32143.1 hypothetical protein SAMN05216290_2827 [Roseivirga pacifica]
MSFNYRKWTCQLFMLAVLFLPASLYAQTQDTLRVLFVGNSYTYFYNLPQMVATMAESQGKAIVTRQSTVGGSHLGEHWNRERETRSRDLIEQGGWDYVVMNNHSMSTINTPEDFDKYGEQFVALIKQHGAQPVFYMTWARKWNPLMQETITKGYEKLVKATGADVVPIGPLWMKSIALRPDIDLYFEDGSHPSPEGTYLTALAYYRFFTGKSTSEIPDRLQTVDKDGEKLYLAIIDPNTATFFQQLVDSFDMKTLADDR